jgi:hypothetical protein
MADLVRFGRSVSEMPQELDFGSWGVIKTQAALDLFDETLAHFDEEEQIKADKERRAYILTARRYYDGNHVKPLKVTPGEIDDNVLVNFCRSIVDDSVSWLFGNPETGILRLEVAADQVDEDSETEDGQEAQAGSDEIGTQLEQIYERSGGYNFFRKLGKRGGLAGHFFIKLVQDDAGQPPRVIVLDPMLCSIRVDPADEEHVLAYKIEWRRNETTPGSRRRDVYIYRQLAVEVEPGAWIVGDFKAKDRLKRRWDLINAGGWPWPWAPIVDGPNQDNPWGTYGLSDLEDIAGINDSINFLGSNTMRILKHHAHPKTIGTGFEAEELQDTSIDSFWTIPNPEAKVQNLEMQSDLVSSMAMLDFLKTAFWTIGRGMDPSVYKDKIGQITNFALRVLAIRAIHKMGDKRLSYGKALREVNRRALEMIGYPNVETTIAWPLPLPEDPESELRVLGEEIALKILSRQTASEQRGRNYELEQKRIKEWEKANKSLGDFLIEEMDRQGGKPTPDEESDDEES